MATKKKPATTRKKVATKRKPVDKTKEYAFSLNQAESALLLSDENGPRLVKLDQAQVSDILSVLMGYAGSKQSATNSKSDAPKVEIQKVEMQKEAPSLFNKMLSVLAAGVKTTAAYTRVLSDRVSVLSGLDEHWTPTELAEYSETSMVQNIESIIQYLEYVNSQQERITALLKETV